jgi:hypothetical protein
VTNKGDDGGKEKPQSDDGRQGLDQIGLAAGQAYAETADAARRTIGQAGEALRAAADSGQNALGAEAERRPVTLLLAALAVGFIFGRAL